MDNNIFYYAASVVLCLGLGLLFGYMVGHLEGYTEARDSLMDERVTVSLQCDMYDILQQPDGTITIVIPGGE